jgi:hypothetical protein
MAETNICCKLTTIRRRRLSFHLQTRPERSTLEILQITNDAIHVPCALRSFERHSAVYVMTRQIKAALKRLG